MKKLYEKLEQALQQYFVERKNKCLFPFGHDWKSTHKYRFDGTGQYIDGKEIQRKWGYDEWECNRCGTTEWHGSHWA